MNNTTKNTSNADLLSETEIKEVLLETYSFDHECEVIKNKDNCCVIKEGDHFYKIRRCDEGDHSNCFNFAIWRAYSDVLREMGIPWDFSLLKREDFIYAIQKREKLVVLSDGPFGADELFQKSSLFRKKLEKKLELPSLMSQLKQHRSFSKAEAIMLASEKPDDCSDYALFGEELVQLRDSGWFLTMLDHDGNLATHILPDVVEVELSYGGFFFGMVEEFVDGIPQLDKVVESSPHWWLFEKNGIDFATAHQEKVGEFIEMIQNNIRFLAGKEDVDIIATD